MKTLIVGNGGRESALAKRMAQSIIQGLNELAVEDIFVEPSSAIVISALNKLSLKDKTVCCVITGSGIRFPKQFELLGVKG